MTQPSPSVLAEFARFSGDMAESLSFNKSLGQIYGLLYASGRHLSLDEIAKSLMMSKGNASINLRVLEEWGAVRPVSVSGSRRDHYEADRNLKELILRRLQDGLGKRLSMVEDRLGKLTEQMEEAALPPAEKAVMKKTLQELNIYMVSGRRFLRLVPTLWKWMPNNRGG